MSDNESKFSGIVDRIEGELAVIELPDGGELIVPIQFLPRNVGDGSVLEFSIIRNFKEEKRLMDEVTELQNSLI